MTYGHTFFWLLLCGHLAGDFYLRPQSPAEAEGHRPRSLLLHGILYAAVISVFAAPLFRAPALLFTAAVAVCHFFLDLARIKLCGSPRQDGFHAFIRRYGFSVGQLLHLAVILCAAGLCSPDFLRFGGFGLLLLRNYNGLHVGIPFPDLARLLFAMMMILKPANRIVRELNLRERSLSDRPAGKSIGILERILIFIFVILQQYAAIALVFTAKSITRYDKIAKDPQFAEYYLTGTLLSLLIAVLSGLLAAPLLVPFLKLLGL